MPFTLQELRQEYKNMREVGFLYAAMALSLILSAKDEAPAFDRVREEDMPKFIEENRKKDQKAMDENPIFRSRFLSTFDDMMK